ncbi:VWA domain-containing protein [Planctomycetota bacterium]
MKSVFNTTAINSTAKYCLLAVVLLWLSVLSAPPVLVCANPDDNSVDDVISDDIAELTIFAHMLMRDNNPGKHKYGEAYQRLKDMGDLALPYITATFEDADWPLRVLLFELACDIDTQAGYQLAMQGIKSNNWRLQTAIFDRLRQAKTKDTLDVLIAMLQRTRKGRLQTLMLDLLYAWTGETFAGDIPYWQKWWLQARESFDFSKIEAPDIDPRQENKFTKLKVISKNVVFVIDISKSMQWGGRIRLAKKELLRIISSFPQDVCFNVIFFSEKVWLWKPDLVPATDKNRRDAGTWIFNKKLEPGTNTFGALTAAVNSSADTVFFLSDGDPQCGTITNMTTIEGIITRRNRIKRISINTIGFFFGTLPPEVELISAKKAQTMKFMRTLAENNNGSFLEVTAKEIKNRVGDKEK